MEEHKDSEYNKLLELLSDQRKQQAKDTIPKMFQLLKKEEPTMDKQELRDKVEKDASNFWAKATILEYIPEEYKKQERAESGKKGRNKQLVAMSTQGKTEINDEETARMDRAKSQSIPFKEEDSRTFNEPTQPIDSQFKWPLKHRIDFKRFRSDHLTPRYSLIIFYHPDGSINWEKTKTIEVVDL